MYHIHHKNIRTVITNIFTKKDHVLYIIIIQKLKENTRNPYRLISNLIHHYRVRKWSIFRYHLGYSVTLYHKVYMNEVNWNRGSPLQIKSCLYPSIDMLLFYFFANSSHITIQIELDIKWNNQTRSPMDHNPDIFVTGIQ